MAKLLQIVAITAILTVCLARHVHPRHVVHMEDNAEKNNENPFIAEIDGMPIEVIRNIKPSRFVPVNNMRFFIKYPPCEEGFERDVLGVCREVWD